jgi:hypothetical protein
MRQAGCINLAINGAALSSPEKNSSHRFTPAFEKIGMRIAIVWLAKCLRIRKALME